MSLKRNRKKNPRLNCEALEERALLAVLAGDPGVAFESNNTLDDATDLGLLGAGLLAAGQSVSVEARIGRWDGTQATHTDDVDIYRVDLRAGDVVTFDIDAALLDDGDELCDPETGDESSNANNVLRLFNRQAETGEAVELASNGGAVASGDWASDNTPDPAIVDFSVPVTGTYYLDVSAATPENTGQYKLTVSTRDDDSERPDVDVVSPAATDGGTNVVSWMIADESGIASATAQIWKGENVIRPEGPVPLEGSFDLETFGEGDYRITITATDADEDWEGDHLTNIHSVLFSIADDDPDPPSVVITPARESDGDDNKVSWSVTDVSELEIVSVQISKDGESIFDGNVPPTDSYDLNSEGVGMYMITVSATDADNDSDNDQLSMTESLEFAIVDDDTSPPVVVLGSRDDIDGQDNRLSWDISDESGLDVVNVVVFKGEETIFDSEVDATGEVNLNSFGPGDYRISVSATDADNDWNDDQLGSTVAEETVTISDDDTMPPTIVITAPGADDGAGNTVSWEISDESGISLASAQIFKDDALVFDSDVDLGGRFDLNSFGVGAFRISVTAADNDNDWVGDHLEATQTSTFSVVDDDTVAPVITFAVPGGTDGADNAIAWNVEDSSGFAEITASIVRDGVSLFSGAAPASGEFDLNPFGPGAYRIDMSATDADNDSVDDSLSSSNFAEFMVVDDDTVSPSITLGIVETADDGANNRVSWTASDLSGIALVTAQVFRNDVQIIDGVVEPTDSFDMNAFGPGDYRITIRATDADNDWSNDSNTSIESGAFTIADDDTDAPVIEISDGGETDGANNEASWNVTDISGLSAISVQVTRNGVPLTDGRVVYPTGSIDLDTLGVGNYTVTVAATDADDDWSGDEMSATATREFTVVDDDTSAPVISIEPLEGVPGDPNSNAFSWTVTDDGSGLSGGSLTVERANADGTFDLLEQTAIEVTDSQRTVSGRTSVNGFGLGQYRLSITASDSDADRAGDSLTSNASAIVDVRDLSPPTVNGTARERTVYDRPGVVDFIFSEDVSASLDASDYILINSSTDEVFESDAEFVWDPNTFGATLDLTGVADLNEGLYKVILVSEGITDAGGNALDGDSDAVAGGDYDDLSFPVTWRGDANRDVDVAFDDFLTLSANFNRTGMAWAQGEFTGDGIVEFGDFLVLSKNFENVPLPRSMARRFR